MSKELNVRKELWQKAHELESKAFEAGDAAAMSEATEWKGRIALGLFATADSAPKELQMPRQTNGLGKGLAAIMPDEAEA